MAAKKSSGRRKYGKSAGKRVKSAMHRMKKGTLKSGAGRHPKVKSREQAIAIGLSEARAKGAKVPARKSGSKRSGAKKSTSKRSTSTSGRKTSTRKTSTRKTSTRKTSTRKRASKSS